MQFTLNENRILEVTNLSGEEAVEIGLRKVAATSGAFVGTGVLASNVSTKRCRAIGAALIAFADAADAAFEVEDLSDSYGAPDDDAE